MITEFDIGPDGSVAFVAGAPDNPCDLFLRRPGGEETQLTQINHKLLAERMIVPTQELIYQAPDGREVQAWLLYPPDFDTTKTYPLAVHIHGGPHVMWGPGMRSMWHEWQANAARGYVVLFCNPRGSEGYGEFWRDAIHADWGVADAPDILAGVDAAIARGGIDPARIAVTGGSYGGYMTTWLNGHTDRFACAVSARGVYNLLSEHSTSDAHELIEIEFDGYPWERYPKLWEHSPLAYAHKINTPLRILHSEQDYRVPISEAEQLFAMLRRRKHVVELVRYPREGHELTRSGEPRHRADHMERTLEWFDRYCKSEKRHA
jgi:dipeptidyl aminopeptidase/acylaminoacyl peptidase